jgi:hypothetical protein
MWTYVHVWSYLAQFFLEWEYFRQSCREDQKTRFMLNDYIFFFRKSSRLWDNVKKCGTPKQVTDGNIIRRMRFACCKTNATDLLAQYVMFIAFPPQQWLRKTLQCYVTRTLTVLWKVIFSYVVSNERCWCDYRVNWKDMTCKQHYSGISAWTMQQVSVWVSEWVSEWVIEWPSVCMWMGLRQRMRDRETDRVYDWKTTMRSRN